MVPPVCGLFGILHLGQDLRPPHSIRGVWQVEAPAAGGERCLPGAGKLQIAQSGPRAELTFSDDAHTSLSVEVDGDHLVAAGAGPCGGLAFEARLAHEPGGDAIVGTLRGCGDCPATAFHAVRAASAKR